MLERIISKVRIGKNMWDAFSVQNGLKHEDVLSLAFQPRL